MRVLWPVAGAVVFASLVAAQAQTVRATLVYGAPGSGPGVNFSPKGTQVALTDLAANEALPAGAVRPAKRGILQVGPDKSTWIPVLVTADAAHPADLCQLFVDRNRNGNFADEAPPVTATPTQNEKTKAWWSSFSKIELSIPYGRGPQGDIVEPYLTNLWIVRDGETAPSVLRFSVGSWRQGTVKIGNVEALVAVMDSNNDAIFDAEDMWSVLGAAEPDAARRVLTIAEARDTNRLMFVKTGDKELVLEFRKLSPDGRALDFAVVDRPMTKAADRAPDDMLAPERSRPRATTPFVWQHANFEAALAQAKAKNLKVVVDFETTWCGPCKQMDEWIWNDAEVAGALNAGYIGVKLDGDIEKALVKRYNVAGYPTGLVVDAAGKELKRFLGYQSSKQILDWLGDKR
jgi:thiol-disulfide isomerase/thioredoxin